MRARQVRRPVSSETGQTQAINMKYVELRKINVSEHIEKKENLSYLSWAWAVDQLLQADENATWEYGEPMIWGETVMVFCTLKAFGKARTAQLPVMDMFNRPIPNPDAFAVNTAMQRCLAKAIALHGIGLYIYAGEDLPEQDDAELIAALQAHARNGETALREAWTTMAQDMAKTKAKKFWATHGKALKSVAMEGTE